MPTVIDALIVKLGLEPKELNTAAPAAGKKLKDLEDQGKRTEGSVKKIGAASKETSSNLEGLTKSLGGFLAVIGGTMALRRFISEQIETNAQLDRFSRNLGLSVTTVSAWGNAVEELGGNAKGLQGTMDMLSKSQTELRLTGQSSLIPYFSALGVSLATVNGQARPVDDILLDLSDRFSKMDRTTANNMGRMMGIDQDTLNLLLQGRREVELTIARQKEYGAVSKEQAAEASKLQRSIVDVKQSFTALGRDLLQQATPAIEKILTLFSELGGWARNNKEFVGDFLEALAVGIGAIEIASMPLSATVLAVGALAAGIVLLYQDYQTWKRGGDSLIDWEKWKPGIDKAVEGMEWLAKKAAAAFGVVRAGAQVAQNAINGNWAGVTVATKDMSDALRGMLGMKPLHGLVTTNDMTDKARAALGLSPLKHASAPVGNDPETATKEQMQKYFTDRGWSAAQAAGIAANLWTESRGRTNALGDHGAAYGLAQWHPDRQAAFQKMFGHDIRLSNLTEQLAFVQHELSSGSERSAGNALRGATSASQAGAIISRLYERPADADGEASRRGSLAQMLAGVPGASAGLAAAGGGSGAGSTTTDASVTNHIGEIKVYSAATDAQGIARDMSRGADFLFTSQANSGLF